MESIDFGYLNLHSIFSCHGDGVSCSHTSRCCYNDALRQFNSYNDKRTVSYKIEIYKGISYALDRNANNACFLNKEEVENHLANIQAVHEFEYNVEEDETLKCFFLNLKISGTRTQHTFVLTWVRYLYEFPFNMFLIEATMLKRIDSEKYSFESTLNLIQVVSTAYPEHYRGDQCLFAKRKALHTLETVKDRLSHAERITGIYREEVGNSLEEFMRLDGGDRVKSNLYWQNFDDFKNKRKPVYDSVYDKLVELKS